MSIHKISSWYKDRIERMLKIYLEDERSLDSVDCIKSSPISIGKKQLSTVDIYIRLFGRTDTRPSVRICFYDDHISMTTFCSAFDNGNCSSFSKFHYESPYCFFDIDRVIFDFFDLLEKYRTHIESQHRSVIQLLYEKYSWHPRVEVRMDSKILSLYLHDKTFKNTMTISFDKRKLLEIRRHIKADKEYKQHSLTISLDNPDALKIIDDEIEKMK